MALGILPKAANGLPLVPIGNDIRETIVWSADVQTNFRYQRKN